MKRPFGLVDDSRLNAQPGRTERAHSSLCRRGRSKCLGDPLLNRSFGTFRARQELFPGVCYLDSVGVSSVVDDRLQVWDGDIPFAVACAHTCSLTAVGQENGGIHVFDHSQRATDREEGPSLFVSTVHQNAIFDVEWSADDRLLATASGDQTVSVLDVPTQAVIGRLHGHTSSVKEIKFDPTNPHLCVTGGRDGKIAVWDLRGSTAAGTKPVSQVVSAHGCVNGGTTAAAAARRNAKTNTPAISITALLYKANGHLVSACASNPVLMSWDLRYLRSEVHVGAPLGHFPFLDSSWARPTQACASTRLQVGRTCSVNKRERTHGVTSLAQSLDGQRIYSMNRNNKVYEYTSSHEQAGPTKIIESSDLVVRSFYSKCSISNDGLLACGNANGSPVIIDTNRAPDKQHHHHKTASLEEDQENSSPGAEQAGLVKLSSDQRPSRTARQVTGGHQQECTGLSWSHDSSVFISIGDDASTRIWRRNDTLPGRHVASSHLSGPSAATAAWL